VKPLTLPTSLLAFAVLATAPCLAAQDVIVTPLAWVNRDPPDQLPVMHETPLLEFPRDLRNTTDFGWVSLEFFLNDKGQSLGGTHAATLPGYLDAATPLLTNVKFDPGRRDGQAVDTRVRCVAIFNPASAAPDAPDATPRLLDSRPATDPNLPRPTGGAAPKPKIVWATVSLDGRGKFVSLQGASPEFAPILEKNVRMWKFAPARRAGHPVAADVRVPFILLPPSNGVPPGIPVPRVVSQTFPVYPRALRASGLRGEVLVDFIVDIGGRVTNAFVVHTLNPAFDEPALDAVRQWKFEPGRTNGVPVPVHMQVPVIFQLPDLRDGGDSGVSIERRGSPDDLPPEYRYDVAPKPRSRMVPVYPYALLRDGTKGSATIRFLIGENGHVLLADVLKTTNLEFGAALLAAVEHFEFDPAKKAGKPTRTILSYEFEFEPGAADLVSKDDDALLTLERKHPERIVAADKLYEPLKPMSRPPAVFPLSLVGKVQKGSAVVEFLVDEDGRARLPRIAKASDAAFGYAAVQAVAAWRFEEPKNGKKPVVVRVQAPFEFKAPATPPPAPKPAAQSEPAHPSP
jgi:TonB family protein